MKEKLFYMNYCPYCDKVREYMKENNIELEEVNIDEDREGREELIAKGGKLQVPMLLIGDQPLYESLDIIEWLKENK